MSRESIAKALKRLREQSGLTADQVGAMVGKSGENNRGQPDAEILMQLCDIYNVGDILAEFRDESSEAPFALSEKEKAVVLAYRARPDMQGAVDTLLGVQAGANIAADAASVVAEGEKIFGAVRTESK
jgi:transcriptional regulator with XRE-family HTH domain